MLIFILILALILRLITLNQSLWLDEAIGALVARDLSYSEIINSFLTVDNHPPLYYIVLKLWTKVFGYSELAIRMPSVIFGVATIYVTYLIFVKLCSDKKIGLLITLLFATSQFHVYFSQEARMYSMAALFAGLTIYSYLHLIDRPTKLGYWVSFSISALILVFTDYMPVFLFPAMFIHALYKKRSFRWWMGFILSIVPIAIAGIFWLPIFLKQSAGGAWLLRTLPQWKELAGGASIKQLILVWMKFTLGRISFTNKALYYSLVAFSSLPFVYLLFKSLKSVSKYKFVYIWFIFPLIISFIASFFIPAFIYFRLMYLLPAFFVLLGLGLKNIKSMNVQYFAVGLIFLVNIFSLYNYYFDYRQRREDWKGAVEYIEIKATANEVVLFSFPEPFAPYRWYEERPEISFGSTDSINADPAATNLLTRNILKNNVTGVYYFEYLRDLSDPESSVLNAIRASGFTESTKTGKFNAVGEIYYFKK